jgi:arylsulfatase A-like enzyme
LVRITDTPNILFIIIDSLRAKNLGCYGYSKPISPNIDKLAKEGLLFKNAFSCSNATDSSLTTIFSGMYPLSHGILGHGGRWLDKQVGKEDTRQLDQIGISLLPEILKVKGYTTLAVDWLGRWHSRGYDYYSGMLHKANPISFPSKKIDAYLHSFSRRYAYLKKSTIIDDAHLVTEHAKLLIESNLNKKFFLFIHYWDAHGPYASPLSFYEKVVTKNRGGEILAFFSRMLKKRRGKRRFGEKIIRYLASIAYIDHAIGTLIETLENFGIFDQTLIILTSDHGESLTEHGIYFDHHGLYDVTIHVPLIMKYQGFPKNKIIDGFVQHFDLVPTVLDLIGLKARQLDGKSILPLINGEVDHLHSAVFAEEALRQRKRTVRTRDYKYIQALSKKGAICQKCKCIHGGMEELYDLNDDPEETKNIVYEKPLVAERLRKTFPYDIKN